MDERTMFSEHKGKYLTRNVKATVPMLLQLFCWNLIGKKVLKGAELDYLQIFEIKQTDEGSEITHRQEQPKFVETYEILKRKLPELEIWVIDDGDHLTMLLPEDY